MASALQPDAARSAVGEQGASSAAAASAEPVGTADGMAALRDAGGRAAAAGAASLAGLGHAEGAYKQRTAGGHAAGAEADVPARGSGQGPRPLRVGGAADGGRLPGAQAASRQPYTLRNAWGGGGAPSLAAEPACGLAGQGGAGASPPPAARFASPCRPAEVAAAGSPASAGPSNAQHSVRSSAPCRPAEGVSAGAAEPAGLSDQLLELTGPAVQAQTQSCRQAEEGRSARTCGAAQRSPSCRPEPSAGVAPDRTALPGSSSCGEDGPGSHAAPAGAAAGLGSAPQRRPAAHSTGIDFERMALPDLSDSDEDGVSEQARPCAEPPAEPACGGPHRGVVGSAPIAFNRVALPDSSDSEGEGGTRPAQTGNPGRARVLEQAQLQGLSLTRQELHSSAGEHAGSRAAEGSARDGAAGAAAASGGPSLASGHLTGAALPDAAAARVWQQVAFKRVRMEASSDESDAGEDAAHSSGKRVRRSQSEGCALLRPAEGSAGQAAHSGLAFGRHAEPRDSSAAACSGAPAAASCVRGPDDVAAPPVVAHNDTELYVDGKLTRWTRVCACLHFSMQLADTCNLNP